MKFSYPLFLDGATGTSLQKAGMPAGACPEKWILENPEIPLELMSDYAKAGSDIILAPTFGANRAKLAYFGLEDKVEEINSSLVSLAKSAASKDGALVAGDMSSLGLFLVPFGDTTFEELMEIYSEQARALEDAGVDLFVVETLFGLAEARAALLAIRQVSEKPVFICLTIDESGKTINGTDPLAALLTLQEMGASAFGLNCSVGPKVILKALSSMAPFAKIPLIAKPNAGLPVTLGDKIEYELGASAFADEMKELYGAGAAILGGCCGTTPKHIEALCSKIKGQLPPSIKRDGRTLIPCETGVFVFDEEVSLSPEIIPGPDMAEEILDYEDRHFAITVRVQTPEDIELLSENLYMIKTPLCIKCSNAGLIERTAMLYNGRLLVDTLGEISADDIEHFKAQYGIYCV